MHALEQQIFYLFGFIPASPGIVLPWLITLFIWLICFISTRNLSIDIPNEKQSFLEVVYENLESFIKMVVGEENTKELLPILSAIFIYIFLANILGLIPSLKSPTSIFSNCLGMALIVFIVTAYLGIKHHGLAYVKHFTGTIWWMAPLMFPIHIIGEISRPISLTLRLFGNIMGEDVVILVLTLYLFPLLVPIPMMLLALFTSFIQALVFTILSGIYFSGAISEGH